MENIQDIYFNYNDITKRYDVMPKVELENKINYDLTYFLVQLNDNPEMFLCIAENSGIKKSGFATKDKINELVTGSKFDINPYSNCANGEKALVKILPEKFQTEEGTVGNANGLFDFNFIPIRSTNTNPNYEINLDLDNGDYKIGLDDLKNTEKFTLIPVYVERPYMYVTINEEKIKSYSEFKNGKFRVSELGYKPEAPEGKEFDKWMYDGKEVNRFTEFTEEDITKNIDAIFKEIVVETYLCRTLYVNDEGETVELSSEYKEANTSWEKPHDPEVEGKMFIGWFNEREFLTQVQWPVTVTNHKDIYAQFRDEAANAVE